MSCETSISNVCLARALLVLYNSYFEDSFWPEKKKLLDARGPFGDDVFKYPARSELVYF